MPCLQPPPETRVRVPRALRGRTHALLLLGLLTAGGCGRRKAGAAGGSQLRAESVALGPIPLRVANRSTAEVVIQAVRGSQRRRLGSAAGLSTVQLAVPPAITADRGTFVIVATQVGGSETYASDPILPQADIRIVLTLAARLAASTLTVE